MEGNKEKQNKYYNVLLTDLQLHTTKPQNPTPWYRTIFRSFRNKKPGRFYAEGFSIQNDDGIQATLLKLLKANPRFQQHMKVAEKLGKEIRIIIPNNLPIFLGKGAIEKLKAKRKKHRPLTRVWRSDSVK